MSEIEDSEENVNGQEEESAPKEEEKVVSWKDLVWLTTW